MFARFNTSKYIPKQVKFWTQSSSLPAGKISLENLLVPNQIALGFLMLIIKPEACSKSFRILSDDSRLLFEPSRYNDVSSAN